MIHLKRPISSELSLKKEREMKAFATIPTLKEFITSGHSLRRTLTDLKEEVAGSTTILGDFKTQF